MSQYDGSSADAGKWKLRRDRRKKSSERKRMDKTAYPITSVNGVYGIVVVRLVPDREL